MTRACRIAFAAILHLVARPASVEATRSVAQDKAILNFALNLECLEAEFYSWAAYGHGLSETLLGGGPKSVGGMKATLNETIQYYAEEIADNEIHHVALLRGILGDDAIACPQMDIGPAFAAAADAAIGATLCPPFSPYRNGNSFLLGAFIFEDVGVTAYHGAAPLILDADVLSYAAGILGVEAYHAGAVRSLLSKKADRQLHPYTDVTVGPVADAISALRASAGGGKDAGITGSGDKYVLVPVDENAVVFSRSTEEVLAIVYLGSADAPGGFFPEGLNGAIR
ncbi:unnamed protein product [Phaeothamnion confervicola]